MKLSKGKGLGVKARRTSLSRWVCVKGMGPQGTNTVLSTGTCVDPLSTGLLIEAYRLSR
jgi:hypothetical protein